VPDITLVVVLQLIVGLGLLNVWLVRAGSSTPYRGRNAQTLKEEFEAYGLPPVLFYVVGAMKVGAALVLIADLFTPMPVVVAAGVVAALMVGAIAMHLKVGDPPKRSIPAAAALLMCLAIIYLV
jgi:uncharacterized membrane protein YphA (DoxX/SURF4 family)